MRHTNLLMKTSNVPRTSMSVNGVGWITITTLLHLTFNRWGSPTTLKNLKVIKVFRLLCLKWSIRVIILLHLVITHLWIKQHLIVCAKTAENSFSKTYSSLTPPWVNIKMNLIRIRVSRFKVIKRPPWYRLN